MGYLNINQLTETPLRRGCLQERYSLSNFASLARMMSYVISTFVRLCKFCRQFCRMCRHFVPPAQSFAEFLMVPGPTSDTPSPTFDTPVSNLQLAESNLRHTSVQPSTRRVQPSTHRVQPSTRRHHFLYSNARKYCKPLILNDLNNRNENGGAKTTSLGFVGGTLLIL